MAEHHSTPSRERFKTFAIAAGVAVVCAALVGTIRYSGPYRVEARELSGWKIVKGEPSGPALVALEPPSALTRGLFRQAVEHARPALVAPAQPSVPLVLRDEYSDSLQGVLTIGDIIDLARDAGVETTRFEPVCVIERRHSSAGGEGQLVMAIFDSPSFERFRQQLSPLFPEQAGAAPFDPNALRPILTIGASDDKFGRWWPLVVEPRTDCSDTLLIE